MAGTADGFLSYNDPSSIHFSSSAGGSRPVRDAADWASPDAVIQIPFDTLRRHHPDVRRLVEENSSLIGTVSNLSNTIGQAQRPQSPLRNPTSQHAPPRQAQPPPTQGRHGSEERQPPPRQLADFENPEFMLWTALDAQRFHSRYGRLACTRDADGEIVSVAREKEIIAIVALIMEQADEFIHTLSQEEQKQIHNYNFFRTKYPWLLTKLATRIEHAIPELSYCEPTSQYKARRWMQSHFKARVETQR
ncbi:unnamed protein product [Tilletia caries]|nr:unnamed protein product [Tilletia caries]